MNQVELPLIDGSQPTVTGESGIVYQQEYNPDNGTIGLFTHSLILDEENAQFIQPGQGQGE